ncbi:MAG: dTMP kinase [Gammaproteobacteria bacterium]
MTPRENRHRTGLFVTLEGIEGVGKSTLAEFVAQELRATGRDVVTTREPGGAPIAEQIRALLLHRHEHPMDRYTELLLVFAARAEHLAHTIRPALEAGRSVVCDRFTDATFAYQGAGRALDQADIGALEKLVQRGLQPDLTFLLDAPVALALSRARRRGPPDRFESERASFFERVRAGYLERAGRFADRIAIIDAAAPVEQVREQVRVLLRKRVP